MPLYLIRHTQPDVPPGLCYGRLDVPLAASFADELLALKEKLHASPCYTLPFFSSPAQRCLQLAHALSAQVHGDARLLEMDFGDWEGRLWSELDSTEARHWGNHWQTERCPGGESLPDVLMRLRSFWQAMPADNIVVIGHAGPLRASLHLLAGLTLEQAFARPIGFGELITLPGNPLALEQNPLGRPTLCP